MDSMFLGINALAARRHRVPIRSHTHPCRPYVIPLEQPLSWKPRAGLVSSCCQQLKHAGTGCAEGRLIISHRVRSAATYYRKTATASRTAHFCAANKWATEDVTWSHVKYALAFVLCSSFALFFWPVVVRKPHARAQFALFRRTIIIRVRRRGGLMRVAIIFVNSGHRG